MKEQQKMRQVSVKIPVERYQYFDQLASEKGISKSQLFSDIIMTECYISRKEMTTNTVELMDAIHDLQGKCDDYLYEKVREVGEKLWRSLLIN